MSTMLMPESPVPLYVQLVATLRRDIESGVYSKDMKLPTEDMMCKKYGVSRITVRKAITALVDAGTVERKQGKGTFLTQVKFKKSYLVPCMSFSETCEANGSSAGAKLIRAGIDVPQNPQVREWLGLRPAEAAVHICRVRTMGERPCLIEDNFFPRKYSFLLDIDLETVSLYSYLRKEKGTVITPGSLMLRIIRADKETAEHLHVKQREPLLYTIGYSNTGNDEILHTCEQTGYSGDFTFVIR